MASRAVSRSVQPSKVLPPPSPFGELLRRSNFASYDPAIRQTYAAPASYIHRGNWGLKRPIANRKRHSAIVLRNFEEHAHYIEWDKAQAQVDFIKRVEELNIQPTLPNTSWAQSLGPYADAIDSEFCPSEGLAKSSRPPNLETRLDTSSSTPPTPAPAHIPPQFFKSGKRASGVDETLFAFGNQGKGSYGTNNVAALPNGDSYIQPNIAAMTPRQFEDYLEELRELRPKFMDYIRQEIKGRRLDKDKHTTDPTSLKDEEIIMKMSAEAIEKHLHRYFLGQHSQDKFDAYRAAAEEKEVEEAEDAEDAYTELYANAPQPIQGQPHRLAGLIYSKPTILETHYTGHAEPGLVLQDNGQHHYHQSESGYVAVFAGLLAKLDKKDSGKDLRPLLEPWSEEGLNVPITPNASGTGTSVDLRETVRDMRMVELSMESPPNVVGVHAPNQPMLRPPVRAKVVVESAVNQNWRQNPHKPGSMQFNAAQITPTKGPSKSWSLSDLTGPSSWGRRAAVRKPIFAETAKTLAKSEPSADQVEQNTLTLHLIKSLAKKPKSE